MNRRVFFKTVHRSFDLLGNPLRLKIFRKILEEGCDCDLNTQEGYTGNCITGVMRELNLPQSTVSTYIKELEKGGLIVCKKNGKFVYCKPKKETLTALKSFIDSSLSQVR